MDGTIERIPIEIPGVKVEGTFNVKCFLDTLYNFRTMKQGVRVSARVTRLDGSGRKGRTMEEKHEKLCGTVE